MFLFISSCPSWRCKLLLKETFFLTLPKTHIKQIVGKDTKIFCHYDQIIFQKSFSTFRRYETQVTRNVIIHMSLVWVFVRINQSAGPIFCHLPEFRSSLLDAFLKGTILILTAALTSIALFQTWPESQKVRREGCSLLSNLGRDDVMTSHASLYTLKVNLIIYFVNKYTT